MNQVHRWRFSTIAGAVALVATVLSLPAHALSLGRISVLSALGEPLRAEIDVAQITPEEASSLKAAVATPEAFKAAGLEYTPVLAALEVTLLRRADGRSYLRLSSSRPVSEPFVDLVIQATWAAGQLTRDYTMLFDPPASRPGATAVAPTAPVLARPALPVPTPLPRPANESSTAATPSTGEAGTALPVPAARPGSKARSAGSRATSPESSAGTDKLLTVKPGDTAGKIAAQYQPGTVSLDQMLVAMLRSNPNAFVGGNINRLKAGAVLDMPGAEAAGAVAAREASRTIIAQSKDFNNFRRKLAEGVSTTPVDPASRQAEGKIQARVDDRAPSTATPDKLTLSKGSVQAQSAAAAAEDAIAKSRQASEASARVAELSKNISDLNKLGAAPGPVTAPAAPAATSSAAKVPSLAVPTPSVLATPVPPVATPPSPAASASLPASSSIASPAAASTAPAVALPSLDSASAAAPAASAPEASQPVASATAPAAVGSKPAAAATPAPETSFLDDLLENPLMLPLAASLLALLAGLGIYSYRKRKNAAPVDSSFLESRLQPDSFFGASGGQRIDTNEVGTSGSSLVYSPSQLDAAGDVDPVAEADVYLAYGRDLQAEEILKEALRMTPARVAIHAKLAEIFAKRRDHKAFETIALQAFTLTQGNGPEWAYVTEMGRELDAQNPLYQPGGLQAGAPVVAAPVSAGSVSTTAGAGAAFSATPTASAPPESRPGIDVDLDFDFPLDNMQDGQISAAPVTALSTPEPVRAAALDELDLDFSDISSKPIALTYPVPISHATGTGFQSPGTGAAPASASVAAPAAQLPDSGMLEFDLDSLSLDLNGPSTRSDENSVPSEEDTLHTKFLLAEEFRSLGDKDGARALAEEVLIEAHGPLRVKTQAFLNSLA